MLRGPMQLQWEEVEAPRITDSRDALVRPLAVARCDLDPAIASGIFPMPTPFVMGHEMVGEVLEVGDSITSIAPGDRVIVPFQLSCMDCEQCNRGHTNACQKVPPGTAFGLGPHGGLDLGGALAERVRVPWADAMLIPLPQGVEPVAAAGIPDNVSDGYRSVGAGLEERPGAPVLVVGGLAPSVGLYAVMAARALGSSRVVYVDDDPARLEMASSLGAEIVNARDRWGEVKLDSKFPVANVLDAGRNLAFRYVEPYGRVTSVSGGIGSHSSLPLQLMYLKGVRYVVGRVHARATTPAVLDLVTRGVLDPTKVISQTVPFSQAVEGMTLPVTKVVFVNDLA